MRHHRTILLVALAGWLLVSAAVWPLRADDDGPDDLVATVEPAFWTAERVNLLDESAASSEAMKWLGGSGVVIVVVGAPRDQSPWQFGYQDTVISEGVVSLDDDGVGLLKLVLPEPRATLACRLLIGGKDSPVVLEPSNRLADVRQRLGDLIIGVYDGRGLVQRYLTAQGIVHDDTTGDLAAKTFDGDLMIIAGATTPEELTEACRYSDADLRGGMTVLVLAPPAGGSCWGIEAASYGRVGTPMKLKGAGLRMPDLGGGPWPVVLRTDRNAQAMVQLASARASGKSKAAARTLVAAERVGQGRVVVAALPSLADPFHNTTGRVMLDQLILWVLAN